MSHIRSTTLDNGLVLLTERLAGVRSLGLCWTLPGGTAYETTDRLGLSGVLTDLLLRGTRSLDSRQHADAFDRMGVSRHAEASERALVFHATMLGSHLGAALPLIVETVRAPRLDERQLEPVRDLALQSLASLSDDPHERVVLNLRKTHVAPPHNRSNYGDESGLRAITHADVTDEHARSCVSHGSVLALAGDVDHEALLAQLTPLLDGWSGQREPLPPTAPGVRGLAHEERDTDQTHIAVCYDGPDATAEDYWFERVRTDVLSGGMSSRLFTEVREKRSLVYSVSARFGADADYGRTTAYAGTTPERAQQTLTVLLDELERITTPEGAVTREEFDRAMVGLRSRLVFASERSGQRARALARDQRVHGRARSLDELAQAYQRVTLDALNDYLRARPLGPISVASIGQAELEVATRSGA